MLYRGILGGSYSGSIGNVTASRARGSQYFRERRVPINPNTERQQNTRISMGAAGEDWQNLGPEYWAAWANFASQVRRTNAIGEQSSRTGFNEYIRWASMRRFANLQLGTDLPLFPAVPLPQQVEVTEMPVASLTNDATSILIQYPTYPFWSENSDIALLVWVGAGRGAAEPPVIQTMLPTHHYFRGPWWLIGMLRGDNTVPTYQGEFALGNTVPSGSKLAWKARLSTRYNGVSAEIGGHVVAA